MCALLGMTLLMGGCAGGTPPAEAKAGRESARRSYNPDEAAALFTAAASDAGPSAGEGRDTWTIVLGSFTGDTRAADARLAQAGLISAGLEGVRLEDRQERTLLVLGAYPQPDEPAARSDLARVRAIEVDGARPFSGAFLAPPTAAAGSGRSQEYDLRLAKAIHDRGALYTLEVAVYARSDRNRPTPEELTQFRAAAEEAVIQLRAEGELAFFYHGPNRSSVTIGLFNGEDHDPTTPQLESTRLRLARARHPTMLLNGAGVRETVRTSTGPQSRMKPTYLVAVPDPE